jgi:hypothetical protein
MTRQRGLAVVTAVMVGLAMAEFAILMMQTAALTVPDHVPGQDHRFYVDAAQRWLDTGALYLPHQTAGPYAVTLMQDVLYPPTALYLFVPFIWLPWILWWLIPLGTVVLVVTQLRPARWAWPLIALVLLWPRAQGAVLYGNTDMWIAAAVAAGVRWGWPAALVVLKPTFAPLAFVASPDKRLVIGFAAVTIASLPMIALWSDYIDAMRNLRVAWDYSAPSVPLVMLPIVAALGSGRPHLSAPTLRVPALHLVGRALRGVAAATPSGATEPRQAEGELSAGG